MTGDATLLELKEVDKSFGGLRVIADLDLVVKEHEIGRASCRERVYHPV